MQAHVSSWREMMDDAFAAGAGLSGAQAHAARYPRRAWQQKVTSPFNAWTVRHLWDVMSRVVAIAQQHTAVSNLADNATGASQGRSLLGCL